MSDDPLQQAVERVMRDTLKAQKVRQGLSVKPKTDQRTADEILEHGSRQLSQAIRGEIQSMIATAWKIT